MSCRVATTTACAAAGREIHAEGFNFANMNGVATLSSTNEMFTVDEFNQNQLNYHNLVRSQHIGPGNDD